MSAIKLSIGYISAIKHSISKASAFYCIPFYSIQTSESTGQDNYVLYLIKYEIRFDSYDGLLKTSPEITRL